MKDNTDVAIPAPRGPKLLGWAVLLLGLPVAFFATFTPPNEYEATLGINALDCDGPFHVYLFAVPALLLFGSGLLLNGLRWRRPANLIVAVVCFGICAAVAVNVARAIVVERHQSNACRLN